MGLGLGEMALILLVILIVVGPDKLPGLARTVARTMRQLRGTMRNLMRDIEAPPDKTPADTKDSSDTTSAEEVPHKPENN